ncbi:hypothetical protein UCRPA7_8032 [Phaeoacremonium minimum UCRPA7]|uniref:Secreted protein n=1 Tax=Phaeoacremonium minimum (strain UCR-PA7) TaxID=1286976 RepID=R8BAW4_PHAM7|nr:hypothetical protein UCRPA7_8032 [Phaeoacremonium minimum UCRPA7]EON96468.1 hypothetical protein UCRPA7_8032 [Phaeoacremonium minimum UCRPA7]
MHVSMLATSVLLAVTPVIATRWVVNWEQVVGTTCCARGSWFNDELGTSYYVPNFDEGCHGATQVAGVKEFCIDWGHSRGHFIRISGEKLCLHNMGTKVIEESDFHATYQTTFSSTPCTW